MPASNYPLCMPVIHIKQLTPVWCWAACCEMLTNHYGSPVSQAQFAAAFAQKFNDPNVSMAAPNEVNWLLKREGRREVELHQFVGMNAHVKPTWDYLCGVLNKGRLIILGMVNHAVLIVGFGYSAMGGKRFLWINDPAKDAGENPVKYDWDLTCPVMVSMVMVAQQDIAVLD